MHGPPTVSRRDALFVFGAYIGGAIALGLALRAREGSAAFAVLAAAAALIWLVGGLSVRRVPPARPRLEAALGIVWGVGLAAVALAIAASLAHLDELHDDVVSVAAFADRGGLAVMVPVTLASALAEELLFRGAMFRVVRRRPALVSTILYVLAAVGTGNVALMLAAAVFGILAATVRVRRRCVDAPAAMHLAFSLVMVVLLPPVVGS